MNRRARWIGTMLNSVSAFFNLAMMLDQVIRHDSMTILGFFFGLCAGITMACALLLAAAQD